MDRREVRITAGFLAQIDSQLPWERGPLGQPSATDFIAVALPEIIGHFAERFDELLEAVPGVPSTRMYIGPGIVVRAVVVHGLLVNEDVIELVGIGLDT